MVSSSANGRNNGQALSFGGRGQGPGNIAIFVMGGLEWETEREQRMGASVKTSRKEKSSDRNHRKIAPGEHNWATSNEEVIKCG